MFDLSRLTETITGLASSLASGPAEPSSNLGDILQNAGLDPSVLQGLSESEVATLLAGYGIDISDIAQTDITQFIEGLGLSEGLDVISAPWGDGTHES